MSLSGARGLVRISRNACEVQAAMVADRVKELDFYQSVTGKKYPSEYGERVSARRRGVKFESNLTQNDAALLRRAVGPLFGHDPDEMWVRDLTEEVPDTTDEIPSGVPGTRIRIKAMQAKRLSRVRDIFKDLVAGRRVPDLLIQPQLRLMIDHAHSHFMYVAPDFLVFDPSKNIYVPGEEKSFIVKDGVGEPGDLEPTRLQAGVEILALRGEAKRFGIGDRVVNRAVFVFSSPYGLSPYPPFVEPLDAEVREINRAVAVLLHVKSRLKKLREPMDAPLSELLDELSFNYQENCIGNCVLAGECKRNFDDSVRLLGDAASDLLGNETKITRLIELIDGAPPSTARESVVAGRLIDAAEDLGLIRRTA